MNLRVNPSITSLAMAGVLAASFTWVSAQQRTSATVAIQRRLATRRRLESLGMAHLGACRAVAQKNKFERSRTDRGRVGR